MMLGENDLEFWEGQPLRHWARTWRVPELHILSRTGSTNDIAKHLAEHGAPPGTTVLVEEQSAGRGRLGRRWTAPYGRGLLLSVVLRPPPPRRSIRIPTAIPIRVGVAVARAVETVAHVPAGLKWPNDILVPGLGKVAGILCEGALGDASEYVIAGIGINVNQTADEWPDDLREHATSLAIASGHRIARAELAGALLRDLISFVASAGEPLDAATLADYGRRDLLAGAPILVDGRMAGTAAGITSDGALTVIGPEGRHSVRGGTVRVPQELPGTSAQPDTGAYSLGKRVSPADRSQEEVR